MVVGEIVSEDQIDKTRLLGGIELFAELPEDRLRALAALARVFVLPAGAEVIEEGAELLEEEDGVYLLVNGEVEVRKGAVDGTDGTLLATLGPGEVFGEMTLLDGQPRSASVFAKTEVQCLVLSVADFQRVLRHNPEIALTLLAVLSRRLRNTQAHL